MPKLIVLGAALSVAWLAWCFYVRARLPSTWMNLPRWLTRAC